MSGKNQFQWEHTHVFQDEVSTRAQEDIDTLIDFFQQECFATEKLDGTNVSKDEEGVIYSKRTIIGKKYLV